MSRRTILGLAGTIATIASLLVAAPGAYAARGDSSTPPGAATGSSSAIPAGAIAIPMVAVPHASSSLGGVQPNIIIAGDCGFAFLYPSNGGDHVHYDFGFEGLSNGSLWVNAHVGATNEDNGEADVNSFGGAAFGSYWEKQGNLYTGTGLNRVSAYIYSFGALYDCESSPYLVEDVYVY